MKKLWFALLISAVVALIVGLTGHVLPRPANNAGSIKPGKTTAPASPSPTPSTSSPAASSSPTFFDSDFSGAALDTKVWATCYPWANKPAGCTNFGNNEHEWFLPAQDQVSGGVLHLVARRIPTQGKTAGGAPERYACRSGMVTTSPSFDFEYGYVRVIARVPNNPGLWTGLWLAPANRHWPPEIDLLEHWGHARRPTGVFFHPAADAPQVQAHPRTKPLAVGWHVFGLKWSADELQWFIDGKRVMVDTNFVPQQPMYFIADLADQFPHEAGGCHGSLLIKSVKIWSHSFSKTVSNAAR
jgi:beta-glucanase (GH16 family)